MILTALRDAVSERQSTRLKKENNLLVKDKVFTSQFNFTQNFIHQNIQPIY